MSERPDWNLWKRMVDAPLWQVVALSLDLSPDNEIALFETPEYRLRLDIATNHIRNGLLETTYLSVATPAEHGVCIADFRAWAERLKFNLPEHFPVAEAAATGANPRESVVKKKGAELRVQFLAVENEEKAKGNPHFVKAVAERFDVSPAYVHKVIGPRAPKKQAGEISDEVLAGRSVFDRSKTPKR